MSDNNIDSQELLQTSRVLDALENPAILVDSKNCILLFNNASQCLSGYTFVQVAGLPVDKLPFSIPNKGLTQSENIQTCWFSIDGTMHTLDWSIAKLDLNGQPCLLYTGKKVENKHSSASNSEEIKERLLSEISGVNLRITSSNYDFDTLTKEVGKIGKLLDLDRMELVKLLDDHGNLEILCNWQSQWCIDENVCIKVSPEILDKIIGVIATKKYYLRNVDQMDEPYKTEAQKAGIKTLFILPITIEGKNWGMAVFVNFRNIKKWQDWEIDICSGLGTSLSIVIDRMNTRKMQDISEQQLEETFQIIPDALVILDAKTFELEKTNLNFKTLIGDDKVNTLQDVLQLLEDESEPQDYELIVTSIKNFVPIKDLQVKLKTRSGQDRICIISTSTFSNNEHPYIIVSIRDVTDLVTSVEKAKETEERLARTLGITPDPMAMFRKGRIIRFNKRFSDLFNSSGIYELYICQLLGSDAAHAINNLKPGEHIEGIPVQLLANDGHTVDCLLSADAVGTGENLSCICLFHDVTELVSLQKKLKESLERYEKLAESVQNGILVLSNSKVAYFNSKFVDMIGYSPDEIRTMGPFKMLHPDDCYLIEDNLKKIKMGGHLDPLAIMRVIRKDGQTRHFNFQVIKDKLDGQDALIITINDVTELVLAKETAMRNQAIVETIVHTIHDVAFVKDLEGRYTYFRWPKEEARGADFSDYIGKTLAEVTPEMSDLELVENYRLLVQQTQMPVKYDRSMKLVRQDQQTSYEIQVLPYYDNTGKLAGTIGIAHNITEELKTKRQLANLENRLTSISKTITDIIFQVEDGKIAYISPSITMYGHKPELLLGRAIEELFGKQWLELVPNNGQYNSEMQLVSPNGALHAMEIRTVGQDGTIVGVARNISERKNFENAKKTFLKSVAHELRNPLTLILGYSELLMGNTKDNPSINEMASIIFNAAESERKRLGEFFDLDKTTIDYNFEPQDLWKLLKTLYTKLWMLAPNLAKQKHNTDRISFTFFSHPDCKNRKISVDENRFSEIFENLVSNSIKYSPPDRISVSINAKVETGRLVVKFSDKGIGIPEKDLPNIFKPFFQVTHDGAEPDGFGLGLANVLMHTQAHGGTIDVSSKLDEGTTITLSFPILD